MVIRFLFSVLILFAISACSDEDTPPVNDVDDGLKFRGRIVAQSAGVEGVVVTDGRTFTQTDSEGYYALPYRETADYIYISTPSGYEVSRENSVSQFFIRIDHDADTEDLDFELLHSGVSESQHYFIVVTDPHARDGSGIWNWMDPLERALGSLKEDIASNNLSPVHIMVGGDIVHDRPHLHDDVKSLFSDLDERVYYAIGNHDFIFNSNEAPNIERNLYADSVYKRHYGPTYYSFNRGDVHYIVLDNTLWVGGGTDRYSLGFTKEQLDWVQENLSFVPSERAVVLMVHGPTKSRLQANYGNSAELHALLSGYRNVQIVSGHVHWNSVMVDHTDIVEHNVGAISGGWWAGPLNRCGAPLGYKIFRVNGTDIKWRYRAFEQPNKQFSVYKPGTFDPAIRPANELLVNVWDWDRNWSVTYSEDGGQSFSNMIRLFDLTYDPGAFELYGTDGNVPGRNVTARVTDRIFRCIPSAGTTQIVVRAVNGFGEEFTEVVDL